MSGGSGKSTERGERETTARRGNEPTCSAAQYSQPEEQNAPELRHDNDGYVREFWLCGEPCERSNFRLKDFFIKSTMTDQRAEEQGRGQVAQGLFMKVGREEHAGCNHNSMKRDFDHIS